ncbi:MAG TPA: phage holin family protein [Candidatus Thermoplasmatota archaeon]|nr:phage holin family protein [Candidatus Thermoplasmatota archaeon]
MTIIDDTASPSDRDAAERIESIGTRAEDSTRRIAAAIAGALEGFVEALEEYDLPSEGKRAIETTGDIARSAAVEGRAVGQTPEMRQAGEAFRHVAHKTGEVTRDATGAVRERVGDARDSVKETVHDVRQNVHEKVENAKYAAYRVKEEVKVRADAVAETGRRARTAPGVIGAELSEWFAAWKRGLMTSILGMLLVAVFGTITLVVLTIALVVGLNEVVGDPQGTWLTALIYVIVAGICYAVARSAKARAAHEREERLANAREEVRHVVRPVRDAFGRGRTNI